MTAILLALGGILVLIALFLESCRRYTEPSPDLEPEAHEHARFPMMEENDSDAKQALNDRHAAQKRETAAIRAVGELGRK